MDQFAYQTTPGTVYFIGAGPGAPDLITIRGQEIIAQADLILYADSLVEKSVADLAHKAQAQIMGSSGLYLEQMIDLMTETAQQEGIVARIHSGDPSLYGAMHEQMAALDDRAIPYEVVPGITAVFAGAAKLKTELTVPDIVQTLILTRTAGRTTMPPGEELKKLAASGSSLAIYLSIRRIRYVVDDLLASGGYQPDTPVAVLHKVTWPDESYVLGTLSDIVSKVKAKGYTKHALILVSPALDSTLKQKDRRTKSHLYDKSYSHRFRKAVDSGSPDGEPRNDSGTDKFQDNQKTVIIAVTRRGSQLAVDLASSLKLEFEVVEAVVPAKYQVDSATHPYTDSVLFEIKRRWPKCKRLILIMSTGIATRAIAPLLKHKSTDPAVLCLDEAGRFVIPLLGGHQAGANTLAQKIATLTEGEAAITTASDIQNKPALDKPPHRWFIDPASALTHVQACLVNDEPIALYLDPDLEFLRPQLESWLGQNGAISEVANLFQLDSDVYSAGIIISHRILEDFHHQVVEKAVLYHPPVLVAGMGCQRGVPALELQTALETTLAEARLALASVTALATVDLKKEEPGLFELATHLNLPLQIIEQSRLSQLSPADFSPSAAQEKFNLPGVAEPTAVLAAENGKLIEPKQSFDRCTVAIALWHSSD